MRCLELPVRRLKSFLLPPHLVVGRLEPLVLGRELLTLNAEPLKLLAEDIGALVGRDPVWLEAGGPGAGTIGDDEGPIALRAADLPSETGRPNAQGGAASRTGHSNPLGLVHGEQPGRRCDGYATTGIRSFRSHEDLVALLATDLLAEV
jgi:hypothetical protein